MAETSFISDVSDISLGTNSSESGTPIISVSKSAQKAAKKRNKVERKKQEKLEKRRQKNKISKDDFYAKSLEFKTWLLEEKNVQYDTFTPAKAREWFKKFIKKWNKKKLSQRYYRGLNSLPVRMSNTDVQSQWSLAFPECTDVTNLDSPFLQPGNTDAAFSTFGKKRGQKLQAALKGLKENSLGDHVYDKPTPTNTKPAGVREISSFHAPIPYEKLPLHSSFAKDVDDSLHTMPQPLNKSLEKAKSVEELYTLPTKKKRSSPVCEHALTHTNKESPVKGVKRKTCNPPMGLMATMIKKHKSLDSLLGFSLNAPVPTQSPGASKVTGNKATVCTEVKMDNIMPKEAEYVYMQLLNTQTPTFL